MLLIVNVQVVLGNADEISRGNGAGIGPNLAPNPSFEDGDAMPTGWTNNPGADGIFNWDSDYSHSGEKSVGVLDLKKDAGWFESRLGWITTDFIPVDYTMHYYLFSVWYKLIGIPVDYQYTSLTIFYYSENYELLGGGSRGFGYDNSEWQNGSDRDGGHNDEVKYVKLLLGQACEFGIEPNPLFEARFDDVYFGIWNTAPNVPTIIGETNGRVGTLYDYTFKTIDPDQDNVTYEIDWGDNTTQTTDLYQSGEELTISHIWGIEKTYSVRVKAIDEYDLESEWANLTVTMPYSFNKPIPQFLELLFQRFPNAFPLLRQLMGY